MRAAEEYDKNKNNLKIHHKQDNEVNIDENLHADIDIKQKYKENLKINNNDETKTKTINTTINENNKQITSNKDLNINEITDNKLSINKNSKSNTQIEENKNESSNYLENLKLSASSTGLSLNGHLKDNIKMTQLLQDSNTVKQFSPVWRQSLAALASVLVTFTAGLTSGYSAILLPQLKETGSVIPGDAVTASWIASMAALPMAPGCLIAGWIMERYGRKTSHFIICVPFILGWILISSAQNLGMMLAGRFFTGLCVGLLGPLGPVYIGETSDPKYRGFFLAGVSLGIALGILVAHLIGTFLHWQWTAIICTVFPVISIFLLMLVPESPTWLISKGRLEEGVKAFSWLRGYSLEAKTELRTIIENQKLANEAPKMSIKEKIISLKNPELCKPLLIMIMFFVTSQFSGINAISFYSIEIVEKSVGKGLDHYTAMLVIDLVRVIMSVVACVVCRRYGRRPMCIISGIWTALSMVCLSMFLYLTAGKFSPNMAWIPLVCLVSYICAVSVGLVPLPWMMCGEVFPIKVRGLGSGISSAVAFAAFFVVVKTAPGMMSGLGEVVTFLIYGVIAAVGTLVMYFILPETRGKSLQEIEDKFKNVKSSVVIKV